MTDNFDEAKELEFDTNEEDYFVTPSRANVYYEEGMDEPVPANEDGVPLETTETPAEELLDGSDLDLPPENVEPVAPVVPDESTPEYAAFNESFKKITGLDYKTAVNEFEAAKAELSKLRVEHQKLSLEKEWGGEYESRLEQVVKRFARYPAEKQVELDSAEGAKKIWAAIERENAKNQKQVPELQRSNTKVPAGSQPKYMFSEKQIQSMSNEEYSKNISKIQFARINGLVKR